MRKTNSGFTLIEVMAVIAIIGILAAVILGISGYVARKGDIARAQADLQKHAIALDEYKLKTGRYWPVSGPVTNIPFGTSYSNALAGYVGGDLRLLDPWNKPYDYSFLSQHQYSIKSFGPDGFTSQDDIVDSRNTL